jgi:hypothetical protein
MGGDDIGEQVILVALMVVIIMVNMMVIKVMVMTCQPTEYNTYLNPWYDLYVDQCLLMV